MKKIVLFIAMTLPAMVWAQGGNFTIKGKVENPEKGAKVYISYKAGEGNILDSTVLKNGTFTFKGKVSKPTSVSLTLGKSRFQKGGRGDGLGLYVDKGITKVTAKDSLKYAIVSGARISTEYAVYKQSISKQVSGLMDLNREWNLASDEERADGKLTERIMKTSDQLSAQKEALQTDFIVKHPDSYISLLAIQDMAGSHIDVDKIEPLFNKLSTAQKNNPVGQALEKRIAAAKKTQIGSIAMDFSQADPDGKQVKLSDFRGKYVLLDFWASWCGPCRAENPNVVSVYHKFKDKNFTVLGISLDNPGKKEDWLRAVAADKLEWTQLSDLKGWKNEVSVLYGIGSVPQNYLIGPDGKILASNLRGEELHKKLAELLNN